MIGDKLSKAKPLIVRVLIILGVFVMAMGVFWTVSQTVLDPNKASCIIDVMIIALFLAQYKESKPVEEREFNDVIMAFMLIGCFLLWFVIQRTGVFVQALLQDPSTEAYVSTMDRDSVFYLVLSLALAPMMEELVFRDRCYRFFAKIMPSGWACVFSSLLFGLVHGTAIHVYIGFMFGVFLMCVYRMTGQLTVCMVLHSLFNLTSLFLRSGIPGFNAFEIFSLVILNFLICATLYICWVKSCKTTSIMRHFCEKI